MAVEGEVMGVDGSKGIFADPLSFLWIVVADTKVDKT